MKNTKGIIEALRAATSQEEVATLTEMIKEYEQVSEKTMRKFVKISRSKRAKLKRAINKRDG